MVEQVAVVLERLADHQQREPRLLLVFRGHVGCAGQNRTGDLRVMSTASYYCSTARSNPAYQFFVNFKFTISPTPGIVLTLKKPNPGVNTHVFDSVNFFSTPAAV